MPYIFGKLWHLALIWAIRKAFQCILQGVRILLAKFTRISPTSENDSYAKTVVVIIVLILLILKLVLLLDYTIDVFKNYMAVSYDEDDHLYI